MKKSPSSVIVSTDEATDENDVKKVSTKRSSGFSSQCYHDQMLEIMAVFGVLHCAKSRLVRLHNHRIAQVRKFLLLVLWIYVLDSKWHICFS